MSSELSNPPPTSPTVFYKVESSDKEVFEISEDVMKQSKLLSDYVSNFGYTAENVNKKDPIPICKVTGPILKLVIEWCEHHKEDAPPDDNPELRIKLTDDIPEWDANFLKAVDKDTLFQLMSAGNYLIIKGLLNVTCKMTYLMIKGKEIRDTFNIRHDFSPEEE